MKEHIDRYKKKLEKSICDYMENPATERSAEAVRNMAKCWMKLGEMQAAMEEKWFCEEDAKEWAKNLKNSDGTTGPHWTEAQTTEVAHANGVDFMHIMPWQWWITMNMIYSDYCNVAEKYGVNLPDFYAHMAKAFLFDEDGPSPACKLGKYYEYIAK